MAKIKSFFGQTKAEAMEKVKEELGLDAVIISTRKVRKHGLRGFFQKRIFEVTAVADGGGQELPGGGEVKEYMDGLLKSGKLECIENQLLMLSDLVFKINCDVASIKTMELQKYRPDFAELYNALVANGVDENNAITIIREANELKGLSAEEAVRTVIKKYLSIERPADFRGQKRIIFVGPTGAGKTTTLAKIAARLCLEEGLNVAMVTQDTYRIGAVEQLGAYAEILDVPLKVIYEPGDAERIFQELEGIDVVLIDTTGRSPHAKEHVEIIKALYNNCRIDEAYLFVSATTSSRCAAQIINACAPLPDYKIIITKTDEVKKPGVILNIKMLTEKPLVYISNGQRVPEDIVLPDADEIINELLQGGDLVGPGAKAEGAGRQN